MLFHLLHNTVKIKSFKFMMTLCSGCIHIALCAQDTANIEKRIDITEFFNITSPNELTATTVTGCNTTTKQTTMDFSQCCGDKISAYKNLIYNDSITGRHSDSNNEIEWYTTTDGIKRLNGIISRLYTLDFKKGLPYHISNKVGTEISDTDTLSIIHANGDSRSFRISTFYSIRQGGTVITVQGDTITETIIHTTGFYFTVSDDAKENRTASYTNIRWEADNRDFPIIECTKYTGWNGDIESATLLINPRAGSKKRTKESTLSKSYQSDLQMLIITDLSGKIQREYTAEEAAYTTDYGLPSGWYIITGKYPDRNISNKKYINGR